jgi:hypothetical protein
MDNYLVISADTHAGLPDAEYKNYLAKEYHEAFEDDLSARRVAGDAVRQSMGADDNEFVQEWYEENEEGLRGGWDAGGGTRSSMPTAWWVRSSSPTRTPCAGAPRPPSALAWA